jgi:hypothetical protein
MNKHKTYSRPYAPVVWRILAEEEDAEPLPISYPAGMCCVGMCEYINVCGCVYTWACAHACIQAQTFSLKCTYPCHIHTYMHTCIHAYTHTSTNIHVDMYVPMFQHRAPAAVTELLIRTQSCVHMYVCMYIYIYIYMQTHNIYTHILYTYMHTHTRTHAHTLICTN